MQVVDGRDARHAQDPLPDGRQRQAARRRLHEHGGGVPREQQRARNHEGEDGERGDRVDVLPARRDDQERGEDRGRSAAVWRHADGPSNSGHRELAVPARRAWTRTDRRSTLVLNPALPAQAEVARWRGDLS